MLSVRRVSVMVLAGVLLMPGAAAAEWFANPFFGKLSNIKYSDPVNDSPATWGIAGGTSPKGIIGVEIDFTKSNEFFGTKADVGENFIRTLTVSAMGGYPIKFGGVTRLRPYGVIGGGLGFAKLALEADDFDFDLFDSYPVQQQNQILDCLDQYGPFGENATLSQAQSCGVPLGEQDTGYFGTLGVGGGVMGFIVNHVGARADFRYFKRIPAEAEEPLDYWRFTFGVVIH